MEDNLPILLGDGNHDIVWHMSWKSSSWPLTCMKTRNQSLISFVYLDDLWNPQHLDFNAKTLHFTTTTTHFLTRFKLKNCTRMANSALKCKIIILNTARSLCNYNNILINFGQLYSNSCYTNFNNATLGMCIACEFHHIWTTRPCIYHIFQHLTKWFIFCRTDHACTVVSPNLHERLTHSSSLLLRKKPYIP